MTSTKVCGRITISWRPMLFKRVITFIAVIVVLSAVSTASFSQSDNTLADRIQEGDRKAALELISRNVPVNAAQPDG